MHLSMIIPNFVLFFYCEYYVLVYFSTLALKAALLIEDYLRRGLSLKWCISMNFSWCNHLDQSKNVFLMILKNGLPSFL